MSIRTNDFARGSAIATGSRPQWGGHHAETTAALQRIPARAADYRDEAPLHERVLLCISGFRAATAQGEFAEYVKVRTVAKLALARFALNEIGAMDVAAKVSVVIAGLQCASSRQRKSALLLKLERDLFVAGPALDELIARYARAALKVHGTSFSRTQRPSVRNGHDAQ